MTTESFRKDVAKRLPGPWGLPGAGVCVRSELQASSDEEAKIDFPTELTSSAGGLAQRTNRSPWRTGSTSTRSRSPSGCTPCGGPRRGPGGPGAVEVERYGGRALHLGLQERAGGAGGEAAEGGAGGDALAEPLVPWQTSGRKRENGWISTMLAS